MAPNIDYMQARTGYLKRAIAALRQWTYHKEFRIEEPAWDPKWLMFLQDLSSTLHTQAETQIEKPAEQENQTTDYTKLLVEISTGLWRTRNRITENDQTTPKEGMERIFRHVQSVFDALENQGVLIKGHTGERWVDRRPINALAYQPLPDLTQDMIIETVKPSVFIGDKHAQMAQVIVGVPPEKKNNNAMTEEINCLQAKPAKQIDNGEN